MFWECSLSKQGPTLKVTPQIGNTDCVIAIQGDAKATLKAAGYNGPVATVDTMSKHPFRGFLSLLVPQFNPSEMSWENALLLFLNCEITPFCF